MIGMKNDCWKQDMAKKREQEQWVITEGQVVSFNQLELLVS